MSSGVIAIVLTFDAPNAVRHCVRAIQAQSILPDAILVVDNHSSTPGPLTPSTGVEVLRLPENRGPAGGYAAGLRHFLQTEHRFAWVMDDDCEPAPDALAELIAIAASEPKLVLATMVSRETDDVINTHGWCGVLIPREIVARVGVPNEDLFWWTEDTEYLQWRIPRAGFELLRCPEAIVRVSRARADLSKPAWKYYYEARNQVYYRITTQGGAPDRPMPRPLKLRVRAWRAGRAVGKLGALSLVREREHPWQKFAMVVRGTFDGLRGHLGPTVRVDEAHRPTARTSRPT